MTKYERAFEDANKDGCRVSWYKSAVPALTADIEKATGKPVVVSGPFGLRAEIWLKCDERYLTITPEFVDGNFQLFFDTGKFTHDCPAESLGMWNGFNNVRAPLPGTVEEIIPLFRS